MYHIKKVPECIILDRKHLDYDGHEGWYPRMVNDDDIEYY